MIDGQGEQHHQVMPHPEVHAPRQRLGQDLHQHVRHLLCRAGAGLARIVATRPSSVQHREQMGASYAGWSPCVGLEVVSHTEHFTNCPGRQGVGGAPGSSALWSRPTRATPPMPRPRPRRATRRPPWPQKSLRAPPCPRPPTTPVAPKPTGFRVEQIARLNSTPAGLQPWVC